MERIVGGPTKSRWFCERTNDLHELHERARPPMRKNDGQRIGVRGSCVDEVDTKPVDSRAKMLQRVCTRFEAPPVVPISPVFNESWGLMDRNTLRPITDCLTLGVPCGIKTVPEVVNGRLRYRYGER